MQQSRKNMRHALHYVLALWTIVVLIGTLILYIKPSYPFYMTFVSYWVLSLYMILYFVLPLKIRTILYGFCLTGHAIVPLVYWILLNNDDTQNRTAISKVWNIFIHGGDFVVIFLHFLLFHNELPSVTIFWNLIFSAVYIAWAWCGYFIFGEFVYPFLDPKDPIAKFVYPSVVVLIIVLSILWVKMHELRNRKKNIAPDFYSINYLS
eukprot:NODE_161_length_16629_cov_0.427344.p8 type:complete len:207 gc:universal NODE_161_length_16629_cov_0.427344:5117-5737(+)